MNYLLKSKNLLIYPLIFILVFLALAAPDGFYLRTKLKSSGEKFCELKLAVPGDVNRDEVLDDRDIEAIKLAVSSGSQASTGQRSTFDLSGDLLVDSKDEQILLRYLNLYSGKDILNFTAAGIGVVGEVGTITLQGAEQYTINLSKSFKSPVVFIAAPQKSQGQRFLPQVINVSDNAFQLKIFKLVQDSFGQNYNSCSRSNEAVTITYAAFEEGAWLLDAGQGLTTPVVLEVGKKSPAHTASITGLQGFLPARNASGAGVFADRVDFAIPKTNDYTIFTQSQNAPAGGLLLSAPDLVRNTSLANSFKLHSFKIDSRCESPASSSMPAQVGWLSLSPVSAQQNITITGLKLNSSVMDGLHGAGSTLLAQAGTGNQLIKLDDFGIYGESVNFHQNRLHTDYTSNYQRVYGNKQSIVLTTSDNNPPVGLLTARCAGELLGEVENSIVHASAATGSAIAISDFNRDGKIDYLDLQVLLTRSRNLAQSRPSPTPTIAPAPTRSTSRPAVRSQYPGIIALYIDAPKKILAGEQVYLQVKALYDNGTISHVPMRNLNFTSTNPELFSLDTGFRSNSINPSSSASSPSTQSAGSAAQGETVQSKKPSSNRAVLTAKSNSTMRFLNLSVSMRDQVSGQTISSDHNCSVCRASSNELPEIEFTEDFSIQEITQTTGGCDCPELNPCRSSNLPDSLYLTIDGLKETKSKTCNGATVISADFSNLNRQITLSHNNTWAWGSGVDYNYGLSNSSNNTFNYGAGNVCYSSPCSQRFEQRRYEVSLGIRCQESELTRADLRISYYSDNYSSKYEVVEWVSTGDLNDFNPANIDEFFDYYNTWTDSSNEWYTSHPGYQIIADNTCSTERKVTVIPIANVSFTPPSTNSNNHNLSADQLYWISDFNDDGLLNATAPNPPPGSSAALSQIERGFGITQSGSDLLRWQQQTGGVR